MASFREANEGKMRDRFGFQKFVDEIHGATAEDDLNVAASRMGERMGFRWMAYLSLSDLREPEITSTYSPKWVSHYFENQFDQIDPCVLASRKQEQPFRWGSLAPPAEMPKNVIRLYDDATSYGIRAGITVPILGPSGRWSAFTLATDEENTEALGTQIDTVPSLMIMVALQFHTRLNAVAPRFASIDRPNILSEQQRRCLQEYANGVTMKAIAHELGISRSAVAANLGRARQRIGAKNATHAVKRAYDLGLIH